MVPRPSRSRQASKCKTAPFVTPAKAGVQRGLVKARPSHWIPACAGMTGMRAGMRLVCEGITGMAAGVTFVAAAMTCADAGIKGICR